MRRHPVIALHPLVGGLQVPVSGAWQVRLDAPARSVMTDFDDRNLVTVHAKLPVDGALEAMKHAGVRSAFVLDEARERVVGLITAHDIMGEKPIQHLTSTGHTLHTGTRDDVTVEDIMERTETWRVVHLEGLEHATVGSVLDAFEVIDGTHLPVVDTDDAGRRRLRGVFSRAKLLRLTRESRASGAARPAANGERRASTG